MATMNVNLPDEMRVRVDALVRSGRFQSNSDYVRDLIRRDLARRLEAARLNRRLDEGLKGPFRPFDDAALDRLEETLIAELDAES